MVSRHAFRGAGTKWIKLDTGDVTDLATLPEATPTKAKAGINDLVLVRVGRHDPRAARGLRARRRPARPGHVRRWLHRVSVARLALPGDGRPRPPRPGAVRPARLRDPRRRGRRLRGPARHDLGVITEIDIPDPSLVVLVGAAGVGKSTFAARHFAPDEILSSDRFRAMVSGDEADQGATQAAFGRLHRELARRLAAGRLTVVDATSVEPSARDGRSSRGRPRPASRPPPSSSTCRPRSSSPGMRRAARGSSTRRSSAVTSRGCGRVSTDRRRRSLREGFAQVVVLRDPAEVDRVRIQRHPS